MQYVSLHVKARINQLNRLGQILIHVTYYLLDIISDLVLLNKLILLFTSFVYLLHNEISLQFSFSFSSRLSPG